MKDEHDLNHQEKNISLNLVKWLFSGLILIFLFSVFFVNAINNLRTITHKHTSLQLETILNTTDETLKLWIHDREDDIKHLSEDDHVVGLVKSLLIDYDNGVEGYLESSKYTKLRSHLTEETRHHGDMGFYLVNRNYENFASSEPDAVGKKNIIYTDGDRGRLSRVFNGETLMILPMIISKTLQYKKEGSDEIIKEIEETPVMFVAAPLVVDDIVIAAVLLKIDPRKDFSRIVTVARFGESGDPYLVDGEGRMITHSRFKSDLVAAGLLSEDQTTVLNVSVRDPECNLVEGCRADLERDKQPLTKMAKSVINGKEGMDVVGYNDYRGVPVVGAWKWNHDEGFGLTIELDVAEAYANFYTIRSMFIKSFLFLGVSFAIYAFLAVYNNNKLHKDIKERAILQKQLREQATTDQLTGVFNRTKFITDIEHEIIRSERYKAPLSILLFDIDFFKKINDSYGHLAGDDVLRKISAITENLIRHSDYLYRWGGEEFIVVATETDIDHAYDLAERLRAKVEKHEFRGVGKVTISVGVTSFMNDDDRESLVGRADDALYFAKEGGRNRTVKFSTELSAQDEALLKDYS